MSFATSPLSLLDGDAAQDLARYFSDVPPLFTGRRFDRLGKYAGIDPEPDRFVANDIIAVKMLSVDIPAEAAIALLETQSDALSRLLAPIPGDIALWDAGDDLIGDKSNADQLWSALVTIDGIAWVTAHKLLARKRPRLLPVYDNVVRDGLRPATKEFWRPLRTAFIEEDLATRLNVIRKEADIGDDISLLRCLDVVLWMRLSRDQTSSR